MKTALENALLFLAGEYEGEPDDLTKEIVKALKAAGGDKKQLDAQLAAVKGL